LIAMRCHPLHGGVDRNNSFDVDQVPALASPPSRGCGSKRTGCDFWQQPVRSPPSRGCGSKLPCWLPVAKINQVTPFTGVWIETPTKSRSPPVTESPPSRGCGSKLTIKHHQPTGHLVTPFTGVWIETGPPPPVTLG